MIFGSNVLQLGRHLLLYFGISWTMMADLGEIGVNKIIYTTVPRSQ
jgi:hypothetical protein